MSRKIVAWGVASSSNEIWTVHESKATAEGVVSLNYNNHLVPLVRRDPKAEAVLRAAKRWASVEGGTDSVRASVDALMDAVMTYKASQKRRRAKR